MEVIMNIKNLLILIFSCFSFGSSFGLDPFAIADFRSRYNRELIECENEYKPIDTQIENGPFLRFHEKRLATQSKEILPEVKTIFNTPNNSLYNEKALSDQKEPEFRLPFNVSPIVILLGIAFIIFLKNMR